MKKIILPLLVICSFISLHARHIIGGTVEYTINSVDGDVVDMDVVFHVYRDVTTGGAQFDQQINIGLFGGDDNPLLNYMQSRSSSVENIESIDFSGLLDCVPSGVNMQSAIYKANFQVDMNNYERFVISYQRCCRAENVFNIFDGQETGIALTAEITRAGMKRIGTVKSFPNIFPVSNLPSEKSEFDFSINDGLTKKYSLSRAQTGGGTDGVIEGDSFACTGITPNPENCPPPYAEAFYKPDSGEYGLYGEVEIDSFSGEFVSELSFQGIYLITVEAESFESGELLSKVYQQFVQIVTMCDPNSVVDGGASEINQEIYPVPANDIIYVSTPLRNVSIFDSKGVNLISQSTFNDNTGIDISGFVAGLYVLVGFHENGEKVVKRFVK